MLTVNTWHKMGNKIETEGTQNAPYFQQRLLSSLDMAFHSRLKAIIIITTFSQLNYTLTCSCILEKLNVITLNWSKHHGRLANDFKPFVSTFRNSDHESLFVREKTKFLGKCLIILKVLSLTFYKSKQLAKPRP